MSFSTGSRVQLAYIAEVVYGTLPIAASPANTDLQQVPFISNNLNLSKAIFEDPSIQSNRQVKFSRHGNREVAGDVTFAYSHEAFDDFLESLCYGTFTTNVLKIGQILKSFSVEVGHLDIDQYRVFTGIVANTLALEVNLDGVVQSTFGLIGKDMTVASTSADNDGVTTAPVKEPFVHFDGSFKEGGATTAIMTSISLNIDNGIQSNFALGDAALKSVTSSMVNVSGTVTAYFEDSVMLNKFINETSTSLELTLDDGAGNSHTWLLPKVEFNGADISVSDAGTIPVSIPFVALYDEAEASTIKITRTA